MGARREMDRPGRGSWLTACALLSACAVLSACASGSEPSSGARIYPGAASCLMIGEAAGDSAIRSREDRDLTIALPNRVDPLHVPVPSNRSEALLFAHLYGTLVRTDCNGVVGRGLAADWARLDEGRRWRFTLRADARFADGSRIDPIDVAQAWARTGARSAGGEASDAAGAAVRALTVHDDRSFTISFAAPVHRAAAFADPSMAIWKPDSSSAWPVASTACRVKAASGERRDGVWNGIRDDRGAAAPADRDRTVAGDRGSPGGANHELTLRCRTMTDSAGEGSGPDARRTIRFLIRPDADIRDLMSPSIDLLVTDDAAGVSFARMLPQVASVALPWDRTYLLLVPSAHLVEAAEAGDGVFGRNPPGDTAVAAAKLRSALARRAVRADARGANPAGWWNEGGACVDPASARRRSDDPASARRRSDDPADGPRGPADSVLVFAYGDRIAGDIAARLVALSSGAPVRPEGTVGLGALLPGIGSGDLPRAAAELPPGTFAAALRAGDRSGYIMSVPRVPLAPCALRRGLMTAAPWLREAGAVVALIETRAHAIVRPAAGPLWFGSNGLPSALPIESGLPVGKTAAGPGGEGEP